MTRAARLSPADIIALLQRQETLEAHNVELPRQNQWFKRQLCGRKSARRLLTPEARQLPLTGILPAREEPADQPAAAHRGHQGLSAPHALWCTARY